MFNSLKEPRFFQNQEKKSKLFIELLFLRKQEKCSNDTIFTLLLNIHNTMTIFMVGKNLSISNDSRISANALIYTEISFKTELRQWGFQNIPPFVCYHDISGTKKSYHNFVKLAFKIPLFSWKLKHI